MKQAQHQLIQYLVLIGQLVMLQHQDSVLVLSLQVQLEQIEQNQSMQKYQNSYAHHSSWISKRCSEVASLVIEATR